MSSPAQQLTPPQLTNRDVTYFETPLLHEPVWKWMIAGYYYVGGLTGASLVLSAAAQLDEANASKTLMRRCTWIGVSGTFASALLLIYDLGRPERFLNMLRVFRPTSPMNVGAWILQGASASAMGTLLFRGRGGFAGKFGNFCGYVGGLFGAALATYTGVLVGNTAVPVWQESRRMLPVLFAGGAMASVGSAFNLLAANQEEARVANRFGTLGQIVDLSAGLAMECRASQVEQVGQPFRGGISGILWRAATVLTAASLLINLLPGRSKKKRVAAGVLGTLGAIAMRFSIEQMGKTSARDPRASFQLQRARLNSARAQAKLEQLAQNHVEAEIQSQ